MDLSLSEEVQAWFGERSDHAWIGKGQVLIKMAFLALLVLRVLLARPTPTHGSWLMSFQGVLSATPLTTGNIKTEEKRMDNLWLQKLSRRTMQRTSKFYPDRTFCSLNKCNGIYAVKKRRLNDFEAATFFFLRCQKAIDPSRAQALT